MREKAIEQKLVNAIKKSDGLCPKLVSPGLDGMPDRLALMPRGNIAFVEVKVTGCKPRPLQIARHEQLRKLGFRVYILDDAAQITKIIDDMVGVTDGT